MFGETSSVTAGSGAQKRGPVRRRDRVQPRLGRVQRRLPEHQPGLGHDQRSWGLDGTTATSGGDGTIAAGETVSVGGGHCGHGERHRRRPGWQHAAHRLQLAQRHLGAGRDADPCADLQCAERVGRPWIHADAQRRRTAPPMAADQDASGGFTVSATPNPPVITNLNGDSVSAPNGTAVGIDQGGNATVTDGDSDNFNGGALTVTRNTGLSGDFSFSGSGGTGVERRQFHRHRRRDDRRRRGRLRRRVRHSGPSRPTAKAPTGSGSSTSAATRRRPRVQTPHPGPCNTPLDDRAAAHTFDLNHPRPRRPARPPATSTAAAPSPSNVEAAPVNTVPRRADGRSTARRLCDRRGFRSPTRTAPTVTTTVSVPGGAGAFTTTGAATVTGSGTKFDPDLRRDRRRQRHAGQALQYTPAVNTSGAPPQTITVPDQRRHQQRHRYDCRHRQRSADHRQSRRRHADLHAENGGAIRLDGRRRRDRPGCGLGQLQWRQP